MNLSYYRNFVKIVEVGTITEAAKELFIAQPALSKQLKIMEEEYGMQLLTRGYKRLYPNNAGKILYEKAKRICVLDDAVAKEIAACALGERGTLKLGITPGTPDPQLNKLLLDFSALYPNVNFDLVEENSEPLMEALQKGTIEIAAIRAPAVVPSQFFVHFFLKEQFMVAYHKSNPWLSPDLKAVPFARLANIPICTPRGIQNMITDNCLKAGFNPYYVCIVSSRTRALMWCSRGTAVSIYVGNKEKEAADSSICHRPLTGGNTDTRRSFISLRERELSAVSQIFIDFCKKQISADKEI